MADALVLGTSIFGCAGSTPVSATSYFRKLNGKRVMSDSLHIVELDMTRIRKAYVGTTVRDFTSGARGGREFRHTVVQIPNGNWLFGLYAKWLTIARIRSDAEVTVYDEEHGKKIAEALPHKYVVMYK
jgi:hypothetical protein